MYLNGCPPNIKIDKKLQPALSNFIFQKALGTTPDVIQLNNTSCRKTAS